MAPPYVLYAMARQGLFPAAFGRLHPRLGTPVLGVLGQGVWAVALLLLVHALSRDSTLDTLDFVCNGVVFVDWLFFAACGAALLRLRATRRDGLRLPGSRVIAALFVAGAAAVTAGAVWQYRDASLAGLALVLVGVPFAVRGALRARAGTGGAITGGRAR
jgi:APA family basic amino acid/polyamine antiporter